MILLLGTFHTFVNAFGTTGTQGDHGDVYGENAVVHMMSGKAVQLVFRGHLLVDQCLTEQIVAKIVEDDPGFQDQVEELKTVHADRDWQM